MAKTYVEYSWCKQPEESPGSTAEIPWERSLGNICSQKRFPFRKRQCGHMARESLRFQSACWSWEDQECTRPRTCGELGNSREKAQASTLGKKRLQEGTPNTSAWCLKTAWQMGLGLGNELPSCNAGRKHLVCLAKSRENLSLIAPALASKALEDEHSGRSYSCSGFFSQQTIDTELLRADSCCSRFIFKLVSSRTWLWSSKSNFLERNLLGSVMMVCKEAASYWCQ